MARPKFVYFNRRRGTTSFFNSRKEFRRVKKKGIIPKTAKIKLTKNTFLGKGRK